MKKALFEGVLLGLTLAILIGPAFFTLLQTAIQRSFKQAVILAIGILFGDGLLIVLCYVGATQILIEGDNKIIFGVLAGIILMAFGIVTFSRRPTLGPQVGKTLEVTIPGPLTYFFKGFFLNVANPFVILFWMGVMGYASNNFGLTGSSIYFFLGTALGTVFLTDLLKSFVADKISGYLKPGLLLWLNRIVGILLTVFGIILIARVLFPSLFQ